MLMRLTSGPDLFDELMVYYVGWKGTPHHLQLVIEVLALHHLEEGLEFLLEPLAVFGGQDKAQPHVSPLDLNGLLQLPDHLQSLPVETLTVNSVQDHKLCFCSKVTRPLR